MVNDYWNHDIFAYLKDFDDPKLPYPEWCDVIIKAVLEYNSMYGTLHDPRNIISRLKWAKQFDEWHNP